MGGGGAIRAAASKFAGINSGIRSGVSPAITAASRRAASATRPSEEVNWSGISANNNNLIDAAGQRPCWELDEWEFAGGERDGVVVTGEPLPRVVFGGVPTLEEAKEATNDLKDALDKIYLSSQNPSGYQEDDQGSSLSLIPKEENLETKACIVTEGTTKSLPTNALKAFKLLNESSAAQSVVASIASDPNVWHAVLQNEVLSEFLQSQKTAAPFLDTDPVIEEFVSDPAQGTLNSSYGAYDSGKSSNSGNWFVDILEGLKSKVVEMKNGLADYLQNLFEVLTSEKVNDGADTSGGETFGEKAMRRSFIGLAVMVIAFVVLKRH